jgi:hypothetical protein
LVVSQGRSVRRARRRQGAVMATRPRAA